MTASQSFVILLGVLLIGLSAWENWKPEVKALL